MTTPAIASRVLGRGSLTALVLNSIVGSGVFVLPGTVAGILGWPAMGAWAIAALIMGLMIASFAEVSSRFTGAAWESLKKAGQDQPRNWRVCFLMSELPNAMRCATTPDT